MLHIPPLNGVDMKFAEYAKMYAALAGTALTALLSAPIPLPESIRPWVVIISVIATAVATAAIPNKPPAA
jgi:hypothetical protein